MRLLFEIKVEENNISQFNASYFMIGDRAYLQNFIGLSSFWLIDDLGVLIKSFDHMLLSVVINITSNYRSLIQNDITEGNLFVMEAEWGRHFRWIKEETNYRISFNDYRDIVMSNDQFYKFIKEFDDYALRSIEYFYKGIRQNPNYRIWKEEIYQNLNGPL